MAQTPMDGRQPHQQQGGILPFWTDLAVFCQAARSFKMMLRHFFVFAIFSGYFLIFGSRWGDFEIRLPLPDCKVRLLRPNTKCAENRLGAADAVTPRQGGSAHLEKEPVQGVKNVSIARFGGLGCY